VLVPAAVLVKLIAAGRAVGTDTGVLYAPSPAALRALTTNSYSWPPVRLVAVQDVCNKPCELLHVTIVALLPSPLLRYTLYPVTAEPVVTVGAAHVKLITVVNCATDASKVGAGGVVEARTAALLSLSPAAFRAVST
jgi:hypothetical protein